MRDFFYHITLIVWKDYRQEFHGQHTLNRMVSFSLSLMILFHFILSPSQRMDANLLISVLWIIFIFTGIMGINRSILLETVWEAYRSIILTSIRKSEFLIGKIISGVTYVFVAEIVTIFFFRFFFNINIFQLTFFIICFLGTVGLISLGVLLSFISISTNNQEFLLSIILFPLVLPLVIPCIKACISIISTTYTYSDLYFWTGWLLVYDVIIGMIVFLSSDLIE
jgi:heme exporter protein B